MVQVMLDALIELMNERDSDPDMKPTTTARTVATGIRASFAGRHTLALMTIPTPRTATTRSRICRLRAQQQRASVRFMARRTGGGAYACAALSCEGTAGAGCAGRASAGGLRGDPGAAEQVGGAVIGAVSSVCD